jgi:hypothetical protein
MGSFILGWFKRLRVAVERKLSILQNSIERTSLPLLDLHLTLVKEMKKMAKEI